MKTRPHTSAHRIRQAEQRLNKYATRSAPREFVTQIAQRMVDDWIEIETNWDAESVGFDETPEERALYEERFAALGEAIARFADLFLLEDGL